MHTLVTALTCFSAVCAFALLMAGWAALLGMEDDELAAFARRVGKPPKRGFASLVRFLGRVSLASHLEVLLQAPAHWKARRTARALLYTGAAFFVVAVAGGSWLFLEALGKPTASRGQPSATSEIASVSAGVGRLR